MLSGLTLFSYSRTFLVRIFLIRTSLMAPKSGLRVGNKVTTLKLVVRRTSTSSIAKVTSVTFYFGKTTFKCFVNSSDFQLLQVYSSNVANKKLLLPVHIAAMASKCPQNILRILRSDYEQGLSARSWDGSLPLHIACQYSSDPSLVAFLLYYDKAAAVNERRKVKPQLQLQHVMQSFLKLTQLTVI